MNNNNSLIKYEEGIFTKFKNFIKRIFGIKKDKIIKIEEIENSSLIEEDVLEKNNIEESTIIEKQIQPVEEIETSINKTDDFHENIQVDGDEASKIIKRRELLEELDGNYEKLNMLSIDRLKKLDQYYEKIIKENEEKINRLKQSA